MKLPQKVKPEEKFITKMPKVELHIHLEGAIPFEMIFDFIQRSATETDIKSLDDLKAKFKYTNFTDFIKTFVWQTSFIKRYDDFEKISYSVLKNLAAQNVKYVEAFCSPADFHRNGLTTEGILECLIKGKEKAFKDFGIRCQLIVDLVRNYGPEKAFQTLQEVTPFLGKGVIGIGLGGIESRFPPELFENVYRKAKELGFKLTAHAGEDAPAKSIWSAIQRLEIQRIGHGVRAYEDPKLLSFLKEKQLPLELCPTSNVMTGICKSIKDHPIKKYFEDGLLVTLNSDDPTMFETSINQEYLLLHKELGFSLEKLKIISTNGIKASFLTENEKISLNNIFEKEFKLLHKIL